MNAFIIRTLQIVTSIAWVLLVLLYGFIGYSQGGDLAYYTLDMDYEVGRFLGLIVGLLIGVIIASIVVGVIVLLIEIRKELQAMRAQLPGAVNADKFS